jgi:hypothetical protein
VNRSRPPAPTRSRDDAHRTRRVRARPTRRVERWILEVEGAHTIVELPTKLALLEREIEYHLRTSVELAPAETLASLGRCAPTGHGRDMKHVRGRPTPLDRLRDRSARRRLA